MKNLVTGTAGFIGSRHALRLLEHGEIDRAAIEAVFAAQNPLHGVDRAAQASVRYVAVQNMLAYLSTKLVGFLNILAGFRHHVSPGQGVENVLSWFREYSS